MGRMWICFLDSFNQKMLCVFLIYQFHTFVFQIGVFGVGLGMDASQKVFYKEKCDCWWKEKLPHILLMLGWRMAWNMLPTPDVLRRKNMIVDESCVLCSGGVRNCFSCVYSLSSCFKIMLWSVWSNKNVMFPYLLVCRFYY